MGYLNEKWDAGYTFGSIVLKPGNIAEITEWYLHRLMHSVYTFLRLFSSK